MSNIRTNPWRQQPIFKNSDAWVSPRQGGPMGEWAVLECVWWAIYKKKKIRKAGAPHKWYHIVSEGSAEGDWVSLRNLDIG